MKKDAQIEAILKELEAKIAEKVKDEHKARLEVAKEELQCELNSNFQAFVHGFMVS